MNAEVINFGFCCVVLFLQQFLFWHLLLECFVFTLLLLRKYQHVTVLSTRVRHSTIYCYLLFLFSLFTPPPSPFLLTTTTTKKNLPAVTQRQKWKLFQHLIILKIKLYCWLHDFIYKKFRCLFKNNSIINISTKLWDKQCF